MKKFNKMILLKIFLFIIIIILLLFITTKFISKKYYIDNIETIRVSKSGYLLSTCTCEIDFLNNSFMYKTVGYSENDEDKTVYKKINDKNINFFMKKANLYVFFGGMNHMKISMFLMENVLIFILHSKMVLLMKHIVMPNFHLRMIKWQKFFMKLLDIIFFKMCYLLTVECKKIKIQLSDEQLHIISLMTTSVFSVIVRLPLYVSPASAVSVPFP